LSEFEPIRGMKDYYGEELNKIKFIEETFRTVVLNSGYQEVYTPIVEDFKLFSLKSGEEIRKTMYVFKDKADREVALRPEITPSIVRVYLNSMQHLPKPLRLFYVGQVYRYDEPQFGRYREFRQAGVELLGSSSSFADIEVISLLNEIYDSLGLKDKIIIKINNIGIYREIFNKAGITEEQQEHLLHLIDKGKVDDALKEFTDNNYKDLITYLISLKFDKLESDKLESLRREVSKYNFNLEGEINKLSFISEVLEDLGVKIKIDLGFVRGLAYYTGVIFEVIHPDVSFSIAGGGRYDNLVRLYGGADTPAIGFAIGVERTALVINKIKSDLQRKKIAVIPLISTKDSLSLAIRLLNILRKNNIIGVLNLKDVPLSKLMTYYVEEGYNAIVLIGKKELEENSITIKFLEKREQKTVKLEKIEDVLINNLS